MMLAAQHQSQCIWQKEMAPSPPFFLCGAQNTVYWVLSLLTFSHFTDVVAAPNSNVMPVNSSNGWKVALSLNTFLARKSKSLIFNL